MDVSIIICAMADRGWLDECIRSAKGQDFWGDYEIILASDGNRQLWDYARKYNIRFSYIEKKNLSANINNAVKKAKGTYIKVLADDDLLTSDCLSILYKNIQGYKFIYASAVNFDEGNKSQREVNAKARDFKSVYETDGIHGGTLMIDRAVFNKLGGYDVSINCCEEYEFYLRYLSHGYQWTYVDKVVYWYRVHKGQKSFKPSTEERIKTLAEIKKRYLNHYKSML
jgi:glycosyltransferase involved in cell wall biosynthesis